MSEETMTQTRHDDHANHIPSDTTVVFGREVTMPGGIYTVVFVALAIITALELLIAEAPLPEFLSGTVLVALSITKAVLVVMFYMHLRHDSRIFTWTLVIPLLMAALIIGFVLLVNPFTY